MRPVFRTFSIATCGIALATLAACGSPQMNPNGNGASYPGQPPAQYPGQYPAPYPNQYPAPNAQNTQGIEYGRVANIEVFQTGGQARGSGVGAVLGGVVGAVVGHQVGGGRGRDLATVVGAVGGAVAGNEIEKNRQQNAVGQAYRVTVQVDRGPVRAYDVPATGDLRIGDRVWVQNGQITRY